MGMPRRVYTYLEGTGWETLNLWSTLGSFVLAAGFALTLLNAIASYRNGEPAGANPWNADTLEWSVASPAPQENFARQPVVTSRHPLWESPTGAGDEVAPADSRGPRPVAGAVAGTIDASAAVAEPPQRWRNTLGTGLLDARPLEIVHLCRPTFVPLLPALGLTTVGIAMIVKSLLLAALGLGVLVLGAVAWLVVNERDRREALADVPEPSPVGLNVSGPGGVGWWGVLLSLVAFGVVVSSVVFAYYYLESHNESWPPLLQDGYPPPVLLPSVAALLSLLSIVPLVGARRAEAAGKDHSSGVAAGVVLAFLLGAGAVALYAYTWFVSVDFGPRTDAYTSAFFAVASTLLLVAAVSLVGLLLLVTAIARGKTPGRNGYLLRNYSSLWYFFVITSLVVYTVLHLVPEVTS